MASICFICHKSSVVGKSQKHRRGVAGKRWKNKVTPTKRVFKPNLQPITLKVNGINKKVYLCTRCIKRLKKDKKEAIFQI